MWLLGKCDCLAHARFWVQFLALSIRNKETHKRLYSYDSENLNSGSQSTRA